MLICDHLVAWEYFKIVMRKTNKSFIKGLFIRSHKTTFSRSHFCQELNLIYSLTDIISDKTDDNYIFICYFFNCYYHDAYLKMEALSTNTLLT